jgi:hypothetical protein
MYEPISTIIAKHPMITRCAMADFRRIKEAYGRNPLCALKQLIPNGKVEGSDYVVPNPRRNDRRAGSFRTDIVADSMISQPEIAEAVSSTLPPSFTVAMQPPPPTN